MKIGVMLAGVNTKFWTAAAQAAEDAGFESVWLPEHLVFPVEMQGSPHDGDSHPPIPSNTPAFDALDGAGRDRGDHEERCGSAPTSTTSACATRSSPRVRSPPSTCISEGRVEFGIGASWLRGGVDRDRPRLLDRGRRVDEMHRHLPTALDRRRGRAPRRVLRLRPGDVQPEAGATTAAEPAHRW